MAIIMDGNEITSLKLKASNGEEIIKQLTEEGGELPTLTNPAAATDIMKDKEAIDGNGNKIIGTHEDGGGGDGAPHHTAYGTWYNTHHTVLAADGCTKYGTQSQFEGASEMESFETDVANYNEFAYQKCFAGCTALKSVKLKKKQSFSASNSLMFSGCTALELVQLGSLGNPISKISDTSMFKDCTQALNIEVYVSADSIAAIPADVTSKAPWGATNATITYKSSVTGEVLS